MQFFSLAFSQAYYNIVPKGHFTVVSSVIWPDLSMQANLALLQTPQFSFCLFFFKCKLIASEQHYLVDTTKAVRPIPKQRHDH